MTAPAARASRCSPPSESSFAAALCALPSMGPRRLRALLDRWPPSEAWRRVAGGRALDEPAVAHACLPAPQQVGTLWRQAAATTDVDEGRRRLETAGVGVHVLGGPGYPPLLASDHEAPAVLFSRGDLGALEHRRVAIVGTRRCTRYGRDVARELGRDLARAGVVVVSGLALGVDGAAHEGALDAVGAPPVGVVGSGLDVVYPRRHAGLWGRVAESGLLLSEAPLGAVPEPWRFPLRNRVIAASAEVVVVVESDVRGGSRHTVEAAMARDRTVMAVPGSVRSPTSAYTNALLSEGCAPVRDALDVLVALDLSVGSLVPLPDTRPPPDGAGRAVLDALGCEPASLEQLVARTGSTPAQVSMALTALEGDGWVAQRSGWWEACGP